MKSQFIIGLFVHVCRARGMKPYANAFHSFISTRYFTFTLISVPPFSCSFFFRFLTRSLVRFVHLVLVDER